MLAECWDLGVIPAAAGSLASFHTGGNSGNMDFFYFLDSCFRGNAPPHPAAPKAPPASPAGGETNYFLRLNCLQCSTFIVYLIPLGNVTYPSDRHVPSFQQGDIWQRPQAGSQAGRPRTEVFSFQRGEFGERPWAWDMGTLFRSHRPSHSTGGLGPWAHSLQAVRPLWTGWALEQHRLPRRPDTVELPGTSFRLLDIYDRSTPCATTEFSILGTC